jgi:hypothetical protein
MSTRINDYTTQDMRNLILKFYPDTYTPQKFGDVSLNWVSRPVYSSVGNIQATINALGDGPYHDYTYTYIKYCPTYVVGYSVYGVQILKGRCIYGGIRDLSASIRGWGVKDLSAFIDAYPPADISAFIYGWGIKDLSAFIYGWGIKDLSAFIYGWDIKDLSAFIGAHPPADISAFIRVIYPPHKDLSAFTRAMRYQRLNAILNPVPPVDLSAYLKVWPMGVLSANIYGWDIKDLAARINSYEYKNLSVYIGTHPWVDLSVHLRGWVREAETNLSAYTAGFAYIELPAILRSTYLKHLSAYVYPVVPVNLGAALHGWDLINLSAFVDGRYGDYDLQASINAVRNIKELGAYINSLFEVGVSRDLPALIEGWRTKDISAYVAPIPFAALSAYINVMGQVGDLPASIYPKTIRLSSVISVVTMEHLDLSGVINPSCIWSEPRDLLAYIRCIYKSDLGATVVGKRYGQGVFNLSASVGFDNSYTFIDRLPISVTVTTQSYRFEDKFPIYLSIFREYKAITASIVGTYLYNDISASIAGDYLELYNFENVTDRIRTYNLDYMGVFQNYETVEISFRSIVKDYFYSSSGDSAWKTDRIDKWILELKSYVPGNVLLNVKRKLHKMKALYDFTSFESVDEAMKFAIEYIISYPYDDITAYINVGGGYVDFPASIRPRYPTSTYGNLQSSITVLAETVVATPEGIGIY